MEQETKYYQTEIDISKILKIIFQNKKLIILFTLFSAILSISVSLLLPNIYTSKALLIPANEESSLGNQFGDYSSLAGIAGISLSGTDGTSKSKEAIARIKSYDFFINEFLPNIRLENLMAVKDWNPKDDQIIYDDSLYDNQNKKWVRKISYPYGSKPSEQESYEVYRDILNVNEDQVTLFVTISVDHFSPNVSKSWVKLIVDNINNYMRNIDKKFAENSINFLESTAQKTNIVQIKETISLLLEEQLQTLMLAEASQNYIFEYIETPRAPEKKSKPLRSLIVVFSTIIGFLISVIFTIIYNLYTRKISD